MKNPAHTAFYEAAHELARAVANFDGDAEIVSMADPARFGSSDLTQRKLDRSKSEFESAKDRMRQLLAS